MRKTNKKGFTIVELVVVIAVIAILAAVLIPTFSGIIKKANQSKDQQAVANMNKYVAIGAAEGEFEHPSEVLAVLYANGWNDGKLAAYTKDHHYAYDFEKNTFYLLDDEDNVIFPKGNVTVSNLWGFYNNSNANKINGVTKYIALSVVDNATAFNETFGDGASYTIDLNDKHISIDGDPKVTIQNGTYTSTSCDLGTDAKKLVAYSDTNAPAVYSGVQTFDGYLFTDDKQIELYANADCTKVVYKNCSFIISTKAIAHFDPNATQNKNVDSIEFENCYFSNVGDAFGLSVVGCSERNVNLKVTDCDFATGRGINVAADDKGALNNVEIKDNTFVLQGDTIKANCIQIANKLNTLTIEGNNFKSGNAAVRAHEDLGVVASGSASNALNTLTFNNNTLAEGMDTVIGDETDKSNAIAAEWAKIFK